MKEDEPTQDGPVARDRDVLEREPVLESYRILDVLGEGGFGRVYLAEQTEPIQRRVALKVIKPGMDSRLVLARFEAERQALALMDHPSVAKVLDAGLTTDGRPFFAMELVRGEPITRFAEIHSLGVEDRVRLMIQVAGAVQHAHMKGVLHRDLKPTNVLVAQIDQKALAKIIDFGVAKALDRPLTENAAYTEQGQILGTPEYVAPEQARGSADIDTRADVYALGVILYELLTGVTPLDRDALRRDGYAGLVSILESTPPVPPSQRIGLASPTPDARKRVRGDLDWIVLKCLEKERHRRYDSAAALAEDLQRYLDDEPVRAGPPSALYRASKFVRRHRVVAGAGLAVVLALLAGVVGTGYGLAEAVRERERARAEAAAAVQSRKESEAVTGFLMQMIQSVQPDESGRDVTVREVLDEASGRLAKSFDGGPVVEARLRHALGVSYWQLGRLEDAEKHLPAVVELRREALGADHSDTLRATANLAALRLEQGRTREAEDLMRVAVDGFTKTLGESDPLTLGALSNLAVMHARRSRDEEAVALHRRVLEGQRKALGPDHPHTLGALFNLSDILLAMGRLDEAEPLVREAVAGWERAHGPEKPGTLLALRGLAMLEAERKRYEEAEATIRRAVEGSVRTLGEGHIDTLYAQSQLGSILQSAGKLLEAETVSARAWEGLRTALGDGHPNTILAGTQVGAILEDEGWPTRAAPLAATLLRALGEAAPGAELQASDLNSVASLLVSAKPTSLRDPETARRLATKACDLERGASGKDLWKYLDTLASAQSATGSATIAVRTQEEALRLLPADEDAQRAGLEERLRGYRRAAR